MRAQRLVAYTKSIGGTITAAELFNEPTIAASGGAPEGYNAATYARDEAAFRTFIQASAPDMLIVGPGSAGEGGITIVPPISERYPRSYPPNFAKQRSAMFCLELAVSFNHLKYKEK